MGNSLCNQQSSDEKNQKHTKLESKTQATAHDDHLHDSNDLALGQDGPTPLKEFISMHQHQKLILASNNLHVQSKANREQIKQNESPRIITKPKLRKQNRQSKRCSIDMGNFLEFQSTIKDFVVTQKNMVESYGRIEITQEKFIHLRREDIKKYYKFQEIVGEGAFGSVYKAVCLKSKELRAVKIIKKQNLGANKKNQVFAELQLLKKMDHPNIIKLYEVFQNQQRYQVVTQFCKGGSIIDFIKGRKTFDEHIIKVILKQLLGCLNYLHTLHIVHRDIKLQNVVFINKVNDNSAAGEVEIKLLDFGTAYKMSKPKIRCSQLVGTVSYMAPQIIKGYFTDKCDLWSCGVILYILLTSKSPFKCRKKEDTLQKILTLQIKYDDSNWNDISQNAKDLLSKLLQKDPYQRLSADQALKHPWFCKLRERGAAKNSGFLSNLSNYYRQNNLISVLESYLIFSKISQEERRKISDIFKHLDKNSDGAIQKTQLIQAYKQYYPNESNNIDQIEYILNKVDKDKSGRINLNQFSSAMINREKLFVKDALEQAFDYFDTDKTGYIQRNELARLLQGSNNHEIEQLLLQLDSDKDKRISKDQFLTYLIKKGCLY